MPRKAALSRDTMIKALLGAHGNVAVAARRLGVSRQTLARRIAEDAELAAAQTDGRAGIEDLVWAKALAAVSRGDTKSIIWMLRHFGFDGGYSPDFVAPATVVSGAERDASIERLKATLDKLLRGLDGAAVKEDTN